MRRKTTVPALALLAFAAAALAIWQTSPVERVLAAPAQRNEHASDEKAIRELNAKAERAWNKHDAAAMDSAYLEDCDFVNVFGQLISGRENLLKIHASLFAGPLRDSYNRATATNIRFIKPDVAIAHVLIRDTNRDGKLLEQNQGRILLLVLIKQKAKWRIAAAQNTQMHPPSEAPTPSGNPSDR